MKEQMLRRLFAAAAVLCLGTAALLYYPPWMPNVPLAPVTAAQEEADRLELNTATWQQLTALPGIGTVKAQAIVEYRDKINGFTAAEQLLQVPGIGTKTFDRIKEYVYLESR